MRNWSEYIWLLNHMVETGFIKTIREIWWDVRPHHNFGTVEVRICDMPPDAPPRPRPDGPDPVPGHDLSEEIDRGTYQYDCHPIMIRQNKWRACRYGMDARLVDPLTFKAVPARKLVRDLLDRLQVRARELGCLDHLEIVREMTEEPTGSVIQKSDLPRDRRPERGGAEDARGQRAAPGLRSGADRCGLRLRSPSHPDPCSSPSG